MTNHKHIILVITKTANSKIIVSLFCASNFVIDLQMGIMVHFTIMAPTVWHISQRTILWYVYIIMARSGNMVPCENEASVNECHSRLTLFPKSQVYTDINNDVSKEPCKKETADRGRWNCDRVVH